MTVLLPTDVLVDRLGPAFGAVVSGLDLSQAGDAEAQAIRALLVEHKVLFFRDQDLTADSQVALGNRMGEVTASHPVREGLDPHHPEIFEIDSFDGTRNDIWHTDVTFMPRPPLGSILRAVELPPLGGDTNWADLEAAYASLSPALQALADGLTAVHDGNAEWGEYLEKRRQGEGSVWDGEIVRRLDPVEHPVVRIHPESGRKSLFVNPGFTTHIKGLSEHESRGLLDIFFAHITKPENIVRHRWAAGDVAMWDNRSTAHYANNDYGDQRRVMHRITLRGDAPFGPSAATPTP